MPITPQQARAELARRELERRSVAIEQSAPVQEQPLKDIPGFGELPQNPILAGLEQTHREVQTIPAAHFINQMGFNLPRSIARKMGYKYPEAQSAVGTVLAKGAGIAGGIMNPVSKIGKLGQLPAGMKLLSKMLQGAKAGAIYGGAYTPTEDMVGIPQRVGGALTGALSGGLLTGASEGIQEGVKALRKLKYPAKLNPSERVSLLERASRTKYNTPIDEARLQQQQINWQKSDVRKNIDESIRQTNISMKQSIAQIDDEIQRSAERGAVDFQEKLPVFFKANSKAYGDRLDEISDALIERKLGSITKGELSDIVTRTMSEVQETGITQGQPLGYLQLLYNKYAVKQGLDELGNIVTDAGTPIDFRKAVVDMRSIWKTVSGQAKQGKFTDTDIVASMLKKNWGEFVGQYAPELQELNTAYRPVIQAMKESARIFKPAQGELATKTAENFLKRLGKQKLSGGEKKLLDMIQQGTDFSTGVGEISQGIENLGEQRVSTIARGELRRGALQQELNDRLGNLDQQNRQLAETINQNKTKLQQRLQSLETGNFRGKEKIMKLMANREKGRQIRKALLIATGIGSATTIPYSISRLFNRIRTNE